MTRSYFIALGGNIGNVELTFEKVLSLLSLVGDLKKSSKVYQSKPLPTFEGISQDAYLNAVVLFETPLPPHQLLRKLTDIETSLGRDRSKSIHWGPRTIDLDIIFAEDLVINDDDLTIPHPRLYFRDFVLVPLNDIDQSFIDPTTQKTVQELERELDESCRYIEKIFKESLR